MAVESRSSRAALGELLAEVSPERLETDVVAICQNVRNSGTEEEARSFDYLEAELRKLGLEVRRHACRVLVSLPGPASLVVGDNNVELTCNTHAFSLSTPPDGLRGDVVYVGAGKGDDLRQADIAGKIALVDGLASPT